MIKILQAAVNLVINDMKANAHQNSPTKRAPDAGDSAAISSIFLRLSLFLVGRLRRPRPSAGNANRWAGYHIEQSVKTYAI